jgi:hypothetical protein
MSNFSVKGFVKGGWPIVIEYQLEPESSAALTITIKDMKQPFVIQLPPTKGERKEIIRQLPEEFGRKPQVGVLSFQAFKVGAGQKQPASFFLYGLSVGAVGAGQKQPAHFFLYGLGVGDKAVGPMVIDQLRFQPGSIRPNLKEKATYSFRSLSEFDTVSADFMLVTISPDNVVRPQLVAQQMLKNGVGPGETVTKEWDGKNRKGKVSQGPHQFYVRVWRGLKSGGDWVFAAIEELVRVE